MSEGVKYHLHRLFASAPSNWSKNPIHTADKSDLNLRVKMPTNRNLERRKNCEIKQCV